MQATVHLHTRLQPPVCTMLHTHSNASPRHGAGCYNTPRAHTNHHTHTCPACQVQMLPGHLDKENQGKALAVLTYPLAHHM